MAKSSKEIIIEQKTIILALVVTIIGLLFIFIGCLPSEFKILGTAMIPAGIITAITEFFLRKDFIIEFRETRYKYNLIERIEKLGIKNIFESRRSEDPIFGKIAQMAKNSPGSIKKLQLMGMSLEPFIHTVGEYMEVLLKNKCKFEFLNLYELSETVKNREKYHETSGLLDRIHSFNKWIKNYIIKEEYRNLIEFRKYSLMPSLHITIINEEKLFVNFYPIFRTGWDFPVIEIDKKGELFEKFKKQFENVWNNAITLYNNMQK